MVGVETLKGPGRAVCAAPENGHPFPQRHQRNARAWALHRSARCASLPCPSLAFLCLFGRLALRFVRRPQGRSCISCGRLPARRRRACGCRERRGVGRSLTVKPSFQTSKPPNFRRRSRLPLPGCGVVPHSQTSKLPSF